MIDKIKFYQKKLSISNSLMDICDGLEFRSKEQFLMDLLEELYKERLERSRERKLKAAKFPVKTYTNKSGPRILPPWLMLGFMTQRFSLVNLFHILWTTSP
ncbi:hypothetical protein PRVXT_000331 [Proteinivorax tanatarense]|uniref:IstB-like ATP-binding protein domain-containing protein n=1 Tax=Proteinivorax tanatarense TaxID=1260629 RepID=A0AAU7VM58_9FIRM